MLRPYDYYQFNDKIIFRMLRPYDYYVLSGRSRTVPQTINYQFDDKIISCRGEAFGRSIINLMTRLFSECFALTTMYFLSGRSRSRAADDQLSI
jgi:hypothetical protein